MSIVKKTAIFSFPEKIISNYDGYEYLSHISLQSFAMNNGLIVFDFSNTTFFQENLCSPFGALLAGLKERIQLKLRGSARI